MLRHAGFQATGLLITVLSLAGCGAPAATPPAPTAPAATVAPTSAPAADTGPLVVYSGRSESLVGPLLERFESESGIDVEVRYGSTTEMAATLLEEGSNSPADLFFAQDAGALGAVSAAGLLAPLPEATLALVEPRFHSASGDWIGVSGRARVVVYNTDKLSESDLPASILDFTDPAWKGRMGWAPTNASFQSFVTAMRVQLGEEATATWLRAMLANEVRTFEGNSAIVQAVADGEIDVGFVDHYYIYGIQAESGNTLAAANYFPAEGDIGALINVAGAGILKTAPHAAAAQTLLDYLLSETGQVYFAQETFEYPLIAGVPIDPRLKPLAEVQTPVEDLNTLTDLQGTLELLQSVGAL